MRNANRGCLVFPYIFVFFFAWFGAAYVAEAHEAMFFGTSKASYRAGESFAATLLIDTEGKSINTISGMIVIPRNILRIVDVRYGNSIVSLWVKQPAVDYSRGTITFTGGIPGGFSGNAGPVLSLGLKAEREGSGLLELRDIQVLLNDGQGTVFSALQALPRSLSVLAALPPPPEVPKEVKEEKSPEEPEEVFRPDTTPPEDFFPLVSRHSSVEGNKYFVSFFAVDKDTGISHYVVHEEPLMLSLITTQFDAEAQMKQGPYVLENQFWPARVMIQAYDQAGNFREASAETPISPALLTAIAGLALLIGAGAAYLAFRTRYGKKLKHKV